MKLFPIISNRILLLLVALTLVRGLIYASLTIPWSQAHDEEIHFAITKSLIGQWTVGQFNQYSQSWPQEMEATFAAFPRWRWGGSPQREVNLTNTSERYIRAGRNSLSYYLYAWFGQSMMFQDLLFQLFALRIVSVLLTCGTVIFAFLSAKHIFAESPLSQILVPWLIIFNPSFMIIDSAINDGNLAVLLTTIVFYLLILEVTQQRVSWRIALAMGLTVLAFWTKATTYFLLIVWGLFLVISAWRLGRKYWVWFGSIAGAIAVSLFFLPDYFQRRLTTIWSLIFAGNISEGIAYALSYDYLRDTFASYWIILGFLAYRLAPIWYIILFLLSLLAVVGLIFYTWRYLKQNGLILGSEQKGLLVSLLFVGTAIGVMLAFVALRNTGGMRLGRYIFPAIGPLSILLVAGWRELLPVKWQSLGIILLIAFFFLFDTLVLLNYAIPWFYPFWPD